MRNKWNAFYFENQTKGIAPSYCIYPMMYVGNCIKCIAVEFIFFVFTFRSDEMVSILYLKTCSSYKSL